VNRFTNGHSIDIYKHEGRDYSNGGSSSRADQARVVAVLIDVGVQDYRFHHETNTRELLSSACFPISDEAPPMALVWRLRFKKWILIDCNGTDDGALLVPSSQMFGGTYGVGSGDWNRIVGHPTALHNRHEGSCSWLKVPC
jgi:hypothetical protein